MNQLRTWFVTLPVIVVASLLAIANRQVVAFNFDPFSSTAPFLAVEAPFFIFILIAVLLGILIGVSSTWLAGGRLRAKARRLKRETRALEKELQTAQEGSQSSALPEVKEPARLTKSE